MRFLVLLFLLAPGYATEDIFGDLLGQELSHVTAGHIRERRQQKNAENHNISPFSQAPSYVKQLVQSVNARPPLVHIPPQPIPNFGQGKQSAAKQYTQAQISQYRPQITVGNAPQQPKFLNVHAGVGNRPVKNYVQAGHLGGGGGGGGGGVAQPQYSKRIPADIQQLLNFQRQQSNSQIQYPQRQHGGAQPVNYQSQLIH